MVSFAYIIGKSKLFCKKYKCPGEILCVYPEIPLKVVNFQPDRVATLNRIRWQLWNGWGGRFGADYTRWI